MNDLRAFFLFVTATRLLTITIAVAGSLHVLRGGSPAALFAVGLLQLACMLVDRVFVIPAQRSEKPPESVDPLYNGRRPR